MSGWFGDPGQVEGPVVTVIGYDGSPLSEQARAAVAAADLVVGGRRHLEAAAPACRTIVLGPVADALAQVREVRDAGGRVVVLASGDPSFFGIVRRLRADRLPVHALPAVSSVAAAFGRLGLPWDDAVVVSAHGRPLAPALNVWRRQVAEGRSVALLTDADSSPAAVIDALGPEFTGCEVFELLGEPGERRTTVLPVEPQAADPSVLGPRQARERDWQQPLLLIAPGRWVHPTGPWHLGVPARLGDDLEGWALPDEAFRHRDRMLTKRDVRAIVLSRLAPAPGTLVWDVGSGSGSVAVECSRLGAAVVAVERAAVDDIEHNAAALHGPVTVVHGEAPAALKDLPHPDAVFVGGGGPEVVAAVAAVRPQRVVVALATLERVAPTVAALAGYDVETVLVQVQQLQPLGDGHRLAPTNPVFVVSGALP